MSTTTAKIKYGTRVKTCMGAIGTVRKNYLCDDGSYNYYIVYDKNQPSGKKFFSDWITRDSFEVIV